MERQNSGNQGDRRADGMRKRGSVRESMSEIFRKARSSFVRWGNNINTVHYSRINFCTYCTLVVPSLLR